MASLLKSRRAWAVSVTAVLLSGVVLYPATSPRFGHRTMTVVGTATAVEVFRLDGEKGPVSPLRAVPGKEMIGGWVVTAKGADQGKEFAEKLAETLSDKEAFGENNIKCFDPGVAFRVHGVWGTVDVLICFKCHNLYCGPPTERAKENAGFRGAGPRLRQLAKEAFPDDKDIQALR